MYCKQWKAFPDFDGSKIHRTSLENGTRRRDYDGYSIDDNKRLNTLVQVLVGIDGRAGNMRGILFELIVANIVNHAWGNKNFFHSVHHSHLETRKRTDIDIIFTKDGKEIHAIECKGKRPGGTVSRRDIQEWLEKILIVRNYFKTRSDLKDLKPVFEFWTTGTYDRKAQDLLSNTKTNRKKIRLTIKMGIVYAI